jgi:hypothetical protein
MRAREPYENETHLECRVSAVHSGWVVGISVGVRLREKRTTTRGSVEDPYVPSPGAGQHTERWYTEETINSEPQAFHLRRPSHARTRSKADPGLSIDDGDQTGRPKQPNVSAT